MTYAIKEIYYTLQGEGVHTGRPAVFCRFTGCNLWSGLESDRATAVCKFCDTEFVGVDGPGGGKFSTAEALAQAVNAQWPPEANGRSRKFVVCTGGEPLLQLDGSVLESLHQRGFEVAVETNGTRLAPDGIDWLCVSPKADAECVLRSGHELKLVYPQVGGDPEKYASYDFEHFYLQPMDGPELEKNTALAVEYCMRHPQWELSLQTQALVGLR